jgi:RNA polymerase sigma-70 factor, ECF subfamily
MPTTELTEPTGETLGVMSDADVASFHTVRLRLLRVASRVLGGATEADDVVQDTWIRWQRADRSEVRDAGAFLVATTTRIAINVGRSARARRETSMAPRLVEPVDTGADPCLGAERREALELAVRAVLEKLSPTERAVYVLREAFDYPYRQIAERLALSEANARQILTRARRRLSAGQGSPVRPAEPRLVHALVSAVQHGDVAAVERLLVGASGDALHAAA